jgi:glycosyltransferase involved in cell wall biosynthesis
MMKVSILIPVYGVEKYIGQCAAALFGQTYDDLEYIFVDDCTPDDSIAVVKRTLQDFPHRRSQTHIIRHDCNRGLGAARKTAFEAATGDFVMNADSDDYMTTDAVARLVERQQQTGADVVTGAFTYHYDDGRETVFHYKNYSCQLTLKLMLIQNTLLPHIWGRLIRRTVYTDNAISSEEGINMSEDLALTPRLIHAASSIAYVDVPIYYYRINSGASTFSNMPVPRHIESYLKACETLHLYFKKKDPDGTYRFAFETGMLHTTFLAMKAGYDRARIQQFFTYRPQGLLFRMIHLLFAHKPILPLLRLSFLGVKWFYKKFLAVKKQ